MTLAEWLVAYTVSCYSGDPKVTYPLITITVFLNTFRVFSFMNLLQQVFSNTKDLENIAILFQLWHKL